MAWNFEVMNPDDVYNADTVCNENFSRISQQVLQSAAMTKEEYEALAEKNADTLYVVIDNGKAKMYLGTILVSGGTAPALGMQVLNFGGASYSNVGAAGGINTLNSLLTNNIEDPDEQEER